MTNYRELYIIKQGPSNAHVVACADLESFVRGGPNLTMSVLF